MSDRDPLYVAAREYLAAEDAYEAARNRPLDGETLDAHGWLRLCNHAKDRVRNAREEIARLLMESGEVSGE